MKRLALTKRQDYIVTNKTFNDHLQVDHYGDFWLTDAVRPCPNGTLVPKQGYRIETFRDTNAGYEIPVLIASVSRELLFETFLDLLDPLGEEVDLVLETSHDTEGAKHDDLYRQHIDAPILQSYCCEFEDLLVNDGCTGVAVISTTMTREVQFDEHKLFIVYSDDLEPFRAILEEKGIHRDDRMQVLTESEHMHSTTQSYREEFEQFSIRLGAMESTHSVSW